MNELTQELATALGDTELRRFVERSAAKHLGNENRVIGVERKLNDYHSSFAIEELTIFFDDGSELPLIFKNLSPAALLAYARQIRPQFNYDPSREIAVYRDLLPGAGLGTAICYGTLADAERQRYWLLLEKVPGHELAKTGEFSIWCDAARWLADMHCRLAEVPSKYEHSANLLRYDEGYCDLWIGRAEHFCNLRHEMQPHKEPPNLKWLAERCRIAVRHICRLPRTFIHGEFYASNVLINRHGNHSRICPLDWETAAIGPAIIDLAALVAGNWTEQERLDLATAYYDALWPPQRHYQSREDFARALRCCRLFMAIKWLGWSSDWQAPDEHRSDWLAEAIHLAPTIESGQL